MFSIQSRLVVDARLMVSLQFFFSSPFFSVDFEQNRIFVCLHEFFSSFENFLFLFPIATKYLIFACWKTRFKAKSRSNNKNCLVCANGMLDVHLENCVIDNVYFTTWIGMKRSISNAMMYYGNNRNEQKKIDDANENVFIH